MNIVQEIECEEILRKKLFPIFGANTQRRMDEMAVNAIRNRKKDAEILTQIASALESK